MKCASSEKVYVFYEQNDESRYNGLIVIVCQVVVCLSLFAMVVSVDALDTSFVSKLVESFKASIFMLKASILPF